MKFLFTALLTIGFAAAAFGQSGRIKPKETPEPKPIVGPSVRTLPAHEITPTPTPVRKSKDDSDDIIKVSSVLVPVPVSVTDQSGRAITNLKLEDFELRVDGRVVELSELARSESPIRLAMLFDNSSS